MKKLLIIIAILVAVSLMLIGCTKKNTEQQTQIDNSIIGVWTHQDVPEITYFKTWTIILKKDGSYKTECENKEMTDIYGDKGTFTLTNNSITFLKEDKSKSKTEVFEIVKDNGKEKLFFKRSTGKNKTSAVIGDKTYDQIFIKN